MEMDWTQDFCLACDRQTNGGAYCSQACRLAELDRSSTESEPASPSYSVPRSTLPTSFIGFGTGFHLPPAIDFSLYKSPNKAKPRPPQRGLTLPQANTSGYFGIFNPSAQSASTSAVNQSSNRALTPSSSRTSLSSMQSTASQGTSMSDQVRNELREYASSFDQVRDWKRRMTTI